MFMSNDRIQRQVQEILEERDNGRPVWVRPPRAGEVEHYSQLGRGKMYQLEKLGVVRTASLKPPGAIRGVKLFNLQSLLDYVESCAKPPLKQKGS